MAKRRHLTFGDDETYDSPKELVQAYKEGLVGAYCDQAETEALLAELPEPKFADAAPDLMGDGAGQVVALYPSYLKFDEGAFSEAQTTGSCVSHSCRNAIDLTRAIEIDIKNEPESFVGRGATEAIYGSRGHGGQGMSCAGAVRYVTSQGGVLLRGKYGNVDLTKLDDSLAASWGRRGTPAEITAEAKKHQVGTAAQITTVEEAKAALANGYAITTCGGEAWTATRDKNGISEQRGSWSHAITLGGFDDTGTLADETLWLLFNSWGKWNRGGMPPWANGKWPVGAWLSRNGPVVKRLRGGGSFAISNVDGWPLK